MSWIKATSWSFYGHSPSECDLPPPQAKSLKQYLGESALLVFTSGYSDQAVYIS